ncbi:hypothetical protein D7V91_04855 [bacterium 1xD42-67]|nr:hypothetical protein D7V91_04855 [bacterium 1xD42-67]
MKKKSQLIALPCDCKCCMFVIEKTAWEDGSIDYGISIQDSRYDHNYNTLWGRMKRAIKILFGKPIYYNDVYLNGEETFNQLIEDMKRLKELKFSEGGIE